MTVFADNLRRLIKKAGLKNIQFAKMVGKTPNTVSRWLSGKNTPRGKILAKIASVLNCSEADLFGSPDQTDHRGAFRLPEQSTLQIEYNTQAVVRVYNNKDMVFESDEADLDLPTSTVVIRLPADLCKYVVKILVAGIKIDQEPSLIQSSKPS